MAEQLLPDGSLLISASNTGNIADRLMNMGGSAAITGDTRLLPDKNVRIEALSDVNPIAFAVGVDRSTLRFDGGSIAIAAKAYSRQSWGYDFAFGLKNSSIGLNSASKLEILADGYSPNNDPSYGSFYSYLEGSSQRDDITIRAEADLVNNTSNTQFADTTQAYGIIGAATAAENRSEGVYDLFHEMWNYKLVNAYRPKDPELQIKTLPSTDMAMRLGNDDDRLTINVKASNTFVKDRDAAFRPVAFGILNAAVDLGLGDDKLVLSTTTSQHDRSTAYDLAGSTVYLGGGDDEIQLSSGASSLIDGGAGNDTATFPFALNPKDVSVQGNSVELDTYYDGRFMGVLDLENIEFFSFNSQRYRIENGALVAAALPAAGGAAGGTILSTDVEVNEAAGSAVVVIERDGSLTGSTVLNYKTGVLTNAALLPAGSDLATAADFTTTAGSITFAPGEAIKTLTIPITNDGLSEKNETLELKLTVGAGADSLARSSVLVTIQDDDTLANTKELNFGQGPVFTPPTDPVYAKYFYYVERYPLTLKTAFLADYKAGKATSQALWGEQHWLRQGKAQGRVLEVVKGDEDINDYGAYVENYGTTLLDIYRQDPRASINGGSMSLFNWGRDHYIRSGQAAGREIDGGVDWGAIVSLNPDLYTRWQDARISDPTLSAFSYGFRNQNSVRTALGVQVGRDTTDKLTGQYVYALGGNDVLMGTDKNDILVGGFGDDLIVNGNGGQDVVFGGPGKDVFVLNAGGILNIRDFRLGSDLVTLGPALDPAKVTLTYDSQTSGTVFRYDSEIVGQVYGLNPGQFSFAAQSDGITNAYLA